MRDLFTKVHARFRSGLLIAFGIALAVLAVILRDAILPPPQRLTQRDINAAVARALASVTPAPSFSSRIYEVIRPSLVRIQARVPTAAGGTESVVGTGVIIDESGTILASLHIVIDAIAIQLTFADDMESEAQIVAKQPENDLLVLRPLVVPDDIVPATLSSSDGLRVGDDVVAVGNPFGISNSLSSGVISGLRRQYRSPESGQSLSNLIQFDAAVNPGNSGGPLVDRNGEVVGIVTALLNPTEQNVFIGIGFAVPIETAAAAAGSIPY